MLNPTRITAHPSLSVIRTSSRILSLSAPDHWERKKIPHRARASINAIVNFFITRSLHRSAGVDRCPVRTIGAVGPVHALRVGGVAVDARYTRVVVPGVIARGVAVGRGRYPGSGLIALAALPP